MEIIVEIKVGDRFIRWEVLELARQREHRKVWLCRCDCGKEKEVFEQNLKSGKSQSCGCLISDMYWKGFGEITLSHWTRAQKNAHKRNIEFKISIEDAWDIYLQQNRICALSGENIYFGRLALDETTASFDRIDSFKGYIEGNVQWVHKDINKLKGKMSDENFIKWCKKVSKYN